MLLLTAVVLLLLGAGFAFFWAVDHGQFDDLETPALLPLADAPDEPPQEPPQ